MKWSSREWLALSWGKKYRHLHVSRFGVIPKSHQPNKWRLIVDLSHPPDWSVNTGISRELCSMAYVTNDDAVRKLVSVGKGALMSKIDIKSAFRLIPVHPANRHLLGMEWNGQFYITLTHACLLACPKLFNVIADLLEWILYDRGVSYVLHYLDDYFTVGGPDSPECRRNLDIIMKICKILGIPLALEKVAGPATSLDFLGILLDSLRMEAQLPQEKWFGYEEQLGSGLHASQQRRERSYHCWVSSNMPQR